MSASETFRKQLITRLQRLRRRAADVAAEIEMVERLIADVENRSVNSLLKLRKNGIAKLAVQGGVRRLLIEAGGPMRAKSLLEGLRLTEPRLKASTFRSHIKRMVDAEIIAHEGKRGLYKLVEKPPQERPERYYSPRAPKRPEYSYE